MCLPEGDNPNYVYGGGGGWHHNKLKNVNLGVLVDNLLLPLCSENKKSLKVKWSNCIDTKIFENMAENE